MDVLCHFVSKEKRPMDCPFEKKIQPLLLACLESLKVQSHILEVSFFLVPYGLGVSSEDRNMVVLVVSLHHHRLS